MRIAELVFHRTVIPICTSQMPVDAVGAVDGNKISAPNNKFLCMYSFDYLRSLIKVLLAKRPKHPIYDGLLLLLVLRRCCTRDLMEDPDEAVES